MKKGENDRSLTATSDCLQKEHIWIALHVETYFKNAPDFPFFCSIYLNVKFGIVTKWKLGSPLLSKGGKQKYAQLKFSIFKFAHFYL